jgi:tetratricopeptide (TPR) repeat protein
LAEIDTTRASAIATGDATSDYEAGLKHWEGRADRASAEAAIASWEKAIALDPNHLESLMKLAYANYFLVNVHLKWEDEDEAEELIKSTYRDGMKAGLHAIEVSSPAFAAAIAGGKSWDEAIPSVGNEGLPAMYWYATNLAKWGLAEGITRILKYKDRIFAIMSHCRDLDPGYWNGAPHRYFGAYWLKIPFGKDAEASKVGFDKSLELGPNYLDTRVLYAEYYAVYSDDEELFKSLLNAVVNTPEDVVPTLIPENRNAIRTAKYMLENMDEWF